jgi:hypothetical protein
VTVPPLEKRTCRAASFGSETWRRANDLIRLKFRLETYRDRAQGVRAECKANMVLRKIELAVSPVHFTWTAYGRRACRYTFPAIVDRQCDVLDDRSSLSDAK